MRAATVVRRRQLRSIAVAAQDSTVEHCDGSRLRVWRRPANPFPGSSSASCHTSWPSTAPWPLHNCCSPHKHFYRATLCVARSYRNSVRLSVCLSVRHTRALCPHGSTYDHNFFINGSPTILVSADITFISEFEGSHPERGHWMRVRWVRIGDFRSISRRNSKTVRDTT